MNINTRQRCAELQREVRHFHDLGAKECAELVAIWLLEFPGEAAELIRTDEHIAAAVGRKGAAYFDAIAHSSSTLQKQDRYNGLAGLISNCLFHGARTRIDRIWSDVQRVRVQALRTGEPAR